MSVNALSSNFFNRSAAPAATPVAATHCAAAAVPAEAPRHEEHRPGGGPNRLVQAIMMALRQLGVGVPAAPAPAATTPAAALETAPATTLTASAGPASAPAQTQAAAAGQAVSTAPSTNLAGAVDAFAHALFQALRHGADASHGDSRRNETHDGQRDHHDDGHGHRHSAHRSYGDIAQRLQALALSLSTPAPGTAPAAPQPSATTPAPVQTPPADAPATAAAATSSAAVSSVPRSSLLEAFSNLFTVLQPAGTAPTDEADMSAKLRLFLQTLAQALQPDAGHGEQVPQVGSLVNVRA